jgi:hypothetical protein
MRSDIDQECERAGGFTRKPAASRRRQSRILNSNVAKAVVQSRTADDSSPAHAHAPSRRIRVQNGAENGIGQELAAEWQVKIRHLPESSAAEDGYGSGFEDWLATKTIEII